MRVITTTRNEILKRKKKKQKKKMMMKMMKKKKNSLASIVFVSVFLAWFDKKTSTIVNKSADKPSSNYIT